jgi:hypothetical protein
MKVVLNKKATYDLKSDNMTSMPFNVFNSLMKVVEKENEELPQMVVFNNRDEYEQNAKDFIIDENKEVLINEKGQIFCHLS